MWDKIFFFFLFFSSLSASDPKKTICLNMIVKNESKKIQSCLASVKDKIDYWVIVDTGSTDGTQKIIQGCMQGIPGKLYERPWVSFGHNRNEALALAKNKGDYLLFIDADEKLDFSKKFAMPYLNKDCYSVVVRLSEDRAFDFQRALLINNHLNWKWEGVIHEQLICPEAKTIELLKEVVNFSTSSEGARSQDGKKFQKDIAILEKAIKDDPANSRHVFYLALTYDKLGDRLSAIKYFEQRASMGGWDQEIFFSLYAIARLHEVEKFSQDIVVSDYQKAYKYRPSRAEPLYRLAALFSETKDYASGYSFAKKALAIPLSKDMVYVEKWIYDYGLLLEYGNCAFNLGKYEEAGEAYQKILSLKDLPTDISNIAKNNLNEVALKKKEGFHFPFPEKRESTKDKTALISTEELKGT